MLASQLGLSKKTRVLRHVRLEHYEMLVLANEDVGRQLLTLGSFERDETAFFQHLIQPNDICIDIGGNVGFFSMVMALAASSGAVHVFEPIPLNAAIIRTNAELNNFRNVFVNTAAVGELASTAQFSISTDSAFSSLKASGRKAEAATIEVPIWALDDYLEDKAIGKVNVMKIDVEGAEGLVITGATKLLSDHARRPDVIMIELFDANLRAFETSVMECIDRMAGFGYGAHVLTSGGHAMTPFLPAMANKVPNIFFMA
jgi:FkbM family methyltransferase